MSSALLADIGGTNARFAILENGAIGCFAALPVADFADPLTAMQTFLAREARGYQPVRAALAAAGPLLNGRIVMTNAAWVIDGETISKSLGIASVLVVNDFTALAMALPALAEGDIHRIGSGSPAPQAPRVVIGPGTGFGLGAWVPGRHEEICIVSEGGHATLAAENRREDAIIQSLRDQMPHVSIERARSGDGLAQLYRAVLAVDALTAPDRTAPEIVAHALAGDCAASRATLDIFCALLGNVAGDIALTFGARGGVYVGGGIVRRFAEFVGRSAFRERFEAKGRMRDYLAAIPTAVIINQQPAFLGLARLVQQDSP